MRARLILDIYEGFFTLYLNSRPRRSIGHGVSSYSGPARGVFLIQRRVTRPRISTRGRASSRFIPFVVSHAAVHPQQFTMGRARGASFTRDPNAEVSNVLPPCGGREPGGGEWGDRIGGRRPSAVVTLRWPGIGRIGETRGRIVVPSLFFTVCTSEVSTL